MATPAIWDLLTGQDDMNTIAYKRRLNPDRDGLVHFYLLVLFSIHIPARSASSSSFSAYAAVAHREEICSDHSWARRRRRRHDARWRQTLQQNNTRRAPNPKERSRLSGKTKLLCTSAQRTVSRVDLPRSHCVPFFPILWCRLVLLSRVEIATKSELKNSDSCFFFKWYIFHQSKVAHYPLPLPFSSFYDPLYTHEECDQSVTESVVEKSNNFRPSSFTTSDRLNTTTEHVLMCDN